MVKVMIKTSTSLIFMAILIGCGSSSSQENIKNPVAEQASVATSLPLGLDDRFQEWEEGVFGPKNVKEDMLPILNQDIQEAKEIVSSFYQSELISDPPLVYLHTAEQFKLYGSEVPFIAMNKFEDEGYIILNGSRSPDENGIAHELSHIEYYERVGNEADSLTPVWFKEGMTLQLDRSGRFAMDSLLQYGYPLDSLPDVRQYASMDELIDAPRPEIFKRLRIAHYHFAQWYSKENLDELMLRISKGEDFYAVYEDIAAR
jgi:hypothetical protein